MRTCSHVLRRNDITSVNLTRNPCIPRFDPKKKPLAHLSSTLSLSTSFVMIGRSGTSFREKWWSAGRRRIGSRLASTESEAALFDFADKYRVKYDSSITVAQKYYRSISDYNDELFWAAAWLYQAFNNQCYLDYLGRNDDSMGGTGWSMTEFGWDVKYAGVQTLFAKFLMQGKAAHHAPVFEGYQQKAKGSRNVQKTPGGLIFRQRWNNMQFVTNVIQEMLLLLSFSPLQSLKSQLFDFADKYRGKYDSSITVAQKYYRSISDYNDELLWAAAWLYQASNNQCYLDYFGRNDDSMGGTGWSMTEFGWDVKYAGVQTLVAKFLMQGKAAHHAPVLERYQQKAESFMCSYLGKGSRNVQKTPGGLIFRQRWNNMQFVTSASFLATVYLFFW
ncbi:unnamed protein product [Sphenostylis stenocarpa]|uniref:cellulase n=1 Tax=Sphenostylis stenocarpa TaxID=92480 RepID=A0AA86S1R8_9FABA|nr:unnamed protein product [Sphenostylis stenocarpa]